MTGNLQNQRGGAMAFWLRTGWWSPAHDDGIELKFNPYHDPRNGQFTFAPGGPRSLSRIVISRRKPARSDERIATPSAERRAPVQDDQAQDEAVTQTKEPAYTIVDAVYRPGEDAVTQEVAGSSGGGRSQRGSNSRAFQDPMTLEQVFPGLRNAPGGTVIALADGIFDLNGPARMATAELTMNRTNVLIAQIRAVDPAYRFETLSFPQTIAGQINQLNHLGMQRAAAFMRMRGELRPMQTETLRFIQKSADRAYEEGQALLRAGRLRLRLSDREALGNFIDRRVRRELREHYGAYRLQSDGRGPIRVNRNENDSSSPEATFRRPDARVGRVAFDVTLSEKTLATPQVRGFFRTDFEPTHVVIIRPRQVGPNSSYVIKRPEAM